MAEFEQNLSQFGRVIAIDTGFTPSAVVINVSMARSVPEGQPRLATVPVIVSLDVRYLYAGSMVSESKRSFVILPSGKNASP